jgi:hypothetical protein
MLPIETEMIGLMMKGASTPLDNIRVSVFLVAWSAPLLAIVRTAQHERESRNEKETNDPKNTVRVEKKQEDGDEQNARVEKNGNAGLFQTEKRSR